MNAGVFVIILGIVAALLDVNHQLDQVHRVTVQGLAPAPSGPFTMLIVGSDSRDIPGDQGQGYGNAQNTPGQRSDTIMLARVVPATRHMTILSIPRDLFVNVAGYGQTRINSAFNNGPNLLVTTIETDLGIPVDHFVEINFDTFKDITDAVGGVKFWFPTPARDAYSLLNVPHAGCVNLTGKQALAFARSRHYQYHESGQWMTQGLSDLARIQRQQAFVKKMIAKAETRFTNPVDLNGVLGGITRNLTVDKGFGNSLMLSLAREFHHADVAAIPTETLPTYNETVDGAEVLGLQQPQAEQMIKAFNALGAGTPKPTSTSPSPPSTLRQSRSSIAPASPPTTPYVLPGPQPTKAELASC